MATVNIINLLETTDSSKCPSCGVVATFSFENEWPYEPPKRKAITSLDEITGLDEKVQRFRQSAFQVRVVKCNSCKGVSILAYPNGVLKDKGKLIWPQNSSRKLDREDLIPEIVKKDFYEASSIETLSPAASSAISRRCLQQILKTKYESLMPKSDKLKAQVNAVLAGNVLPSYISDELHSIRSIGNNAAHPNFDPATNQIIEVDSNEASECLDVLESLIDFCYISPVKALERKQKRESKFGPDTK